jgi:hypothetical protein
VNILSLFVLLVSTTINQFLCLSLNLTANPEVEIKQQEELGTG